MPHLSIASDELLENPSFRGESDSELESEESGAPEQRVFAVPLGSHALRLDQMLAGEVTEFSRSYLQQRIESGDVCLNGRISSKSSARVKVGDAVSLLLRPTLESQAFRPEFMALDVVFEDKHLLVIDKPAGLVVHPAPGNWSGTLLNGLLAHHPGAAGLPRAGIVHRLDKDTSGLMVVAKERSVMDGLSKLIASREVSRQYLAVAHRTWTGAASQRVELAIGRDPRNRLKMAVVDLARQSGKLALTDISLLSTTKSHCLVHCKLHTGRTHQIRVHMAAIGHPLVSDPVYGGAPEAGLARQALHAFRLKFRHPSTQRELSFASLLPQDLASALSQLGLEYTTPASAQ
jgi:23S rRNA pseudouridine1911/1915/1917 synthase